MLEENIFKCCGMFEWRFLNVIDINFICCLFKLYEGIER